MKSYISWEVQSFDNPNLTEEQQEVQRDELFSFVMQVQKEAEQAYLAVLDNELEKFNSFPCNIDVESK